jgi:hypothetical protein
MQESVVILVELIQRRVRTCRFRSDRVKCSLHSIIREALSDKSTSQISHEVEVSSEVSPNGLSAEPAVDNCTSRMSGSTGDNGQPEELFQ